VRFEQRKRWRKHTGNQSIEPLRIDRPATVDDLREIVRTTESDGATVRAVGSGHSWSDVALTTGYLLQTDRLAGWLDVTHHDGETLVRVEAGMRRASSTGSSRTAVSPSLRWAATTPRPWRA
jgi:FAD/FMN-containing dehydrogenase